MQRILSAGQFNEFLAVVNIARRYRLPMIRNFLLHAKPSGIVLKLHQLLRCSGIDPRFGSYAAVQAVANDAQDVSVQMVFIVWRLHRQYAVFKMQGIVCVGFGGCVDQVHVHVDVDAAVVWRGTSQGTGELHIVCQVAGADSEFLHAVVRRVPRCIRLGISRIPCPDERARGVLRRDVRLALLHFCTKGNNRNLEGIFR